MKSMKRLLFLALAVILMGGIAGVMLVKRQVGRGSASQASTAAKTELAQLKNEAQPTAPPTVAPVAPPTPENPQQLQPIEASGQTNSTPQQAEAQVNQLGPPAKAALKDAAARIALAWVGADEEAEAYWYVAINDPSLPPNERQDLIEDLNEDGLSDPKHPTADDLPLIASRLLLLEEIGPYAMDGVNADAFQEAYKDLVNLANLAIGGGEPVR
jgi:hypothetical protein